MLSEDQLLAFMQEAIALSLEGMRKNEGGPFGCVIVKDGEIIGRGNNKVTSAHDPTAHAEVTAIRDACQHLGTHDLSGCLAFTSCEPCPMCLGALYWSRVDKVYYGNNRHDAAAIGFDDEFFYIELDKKIEQRSIPFIQLGQEEAKAAFEEWKAKADRIDY